MVKNFVVDPDAAEEDTFESDLENLDLDD